MDLDQELDAFQQKYDKLEEQAQSGSVERHVYGQIASYIRNSQRRTPALTRAFETQADLMTLAGSLDPPNRRYMVQEAIKELRQIADLPEFR